MKYRLNNKPITEADFIRLFDGKMREFVKAAFAEAAEEGQDRVMFRTNLGPLVVTK